MKLKPQLSLLFALILAGQAIVVADEKQALFDSINARSEASWDLALKIWGWSEPGYKEKRSAEAIALMLEQAGFDVKRSAAGIPTAFVATYGTQKPVIALLGEYDALPGLSQEALPHRKAREGIDYGHACGHHLFGVASASAAIAIAEQIEARELTGTIRYYGCPAEEGGSAKAFMVRDGLFDGCDAALHWHPSSVNSAGDPTCMARIAVKFRFHGKSAHAAQSPELGRSAADAVDVTNYAAELMREHTPDFTRIHHVVTNGGSAPNVVPDFAEVFYYVRHPESQVVRSLYDRLTLCAKAGALATETELKVEYLGGTIEVLPNNVLAEVTMANLSKLNDLKYSAPEVEFAEMIQTTLADPSPLDHISRVNNRRGLLLKQSTDVGDVSWVVPTTGFTTACWVPGTPAHSWQAVAAGGMSIGRKGMNLASRVLAATCWDVLKNPKILAAAKKEHQRQLEDLGGYKTFLNPDQKPPLDYRSVSTTPKPNFRALNYKD